MRAKGMIRMHMRWSPGRQKGQDVSEGRGEVESQLIGSVETVGRGRGVRW